MEYQALIFVFLLLLIAIFYLLFNYDFLPNDIRVKEKLIDMIDSPIYLNKKFRQQMIEFNDYLTILETHAEALASHWDKVIIEDKELKLKINKIKEILKQSYP